MTISKLADLTNQYVQLHSDVRIKLKASMAHMEGVYSSWVADANKCATNAVGQQCRNSLAKYGNLLQAISAAASRGPPIWGPITNNRGPLCPT